MYVATVSHWNSWSAPKPKRRDNFLAPVVFCHYLILWCSIFPVTFRLWHHFKHTWFKDTRFLKLITGEGQWGILDFFTQKYDRDDSWAIMQSAPLLVSLSSLPLPLPRGHKWILWNTLSSVFGLCLLTPCYVSIWLAWGFWPGAMNSCCCWSFHSLIFYVENSI